MTAAAPAPGGRREPAGASGALAVGGAIVAMLGIAVGIGIGTATAPPPIERAPVDGSGAGTGAGTAAARSASPSLPPLESFVGRSFFEDPWVAAPASTTLRDGLGPLYNAHACASCHRATAPGPAAAGEPPVGMVLRIGRRNGVSFVGDPVYGDVIQRRSLPGVAGGMGEARWRLAHVVEQVDDGLGEARRLRRPVPRIDSLAYGDPGPGLLSSLRVAPALGVAGAIERVPDAALLALEDPDDRDGDGISGRVHHLPGTDGAERRIGRFGHKAAQPSLAHQVGVALRDDLGITSRLFPAEACSSAQTDCASAPGGAGPDGPHEIPDGILDALVAYVASLATPAAHAGVEAHGRGSGVAREGPRLFLQAGCAACHVPALPGIDGKEVALYSDLLLHDMGDGLADALGEGDATGAEWRTAPLVGLGARERGGLLHDGRARGLDEAILWHGGEAAPARERYRAMDEGQREALLDHLRAL